MTVDPESDQRPTSQQRWDRAWADATDAGEPSGFITSWSDALPADGVGIDIAGGTGKHAIWLAERGLQMTVTDVSPIGLAKAEAFAAARGVQLDTLVWDIESDGPPPGTWDVIVKTYFLARDALVALGCQLNPGGVLLFAQPTETNLQRHDRPSRRFLLADGEVRQLADRIVAESAAIGVEVEVLASDEEWRPNGAHEAHLVIRRQR